MTGKQGPLRSRNDFEAQWKSDLAFAEHALLQNGALSPMFVVHGRSGSTRIVPAVWDGPEDKHAFSILMKHVCIADDAIAVSSMLEGWIVVGPELVAAPSQSDRRQECIMVTLVGTTADTGEPIQLNSVKIMERDERGKVVGVTPLTTEEEGGIDLVGPLLDLLPEARPSAEERRRARVAVARLQKRMRRGRTPTVH